MFLITRRSFPILALTLFLNVAFAAPVQDLRGESLSGKSVTLPQDLGAKRGLILLGFAHAAREPVQAWWDRVAPTCKSQPELVCYTASVIEGAPAMMRGFVTSRIRGRVPENRHDHYVLISENGAAWKAAAAFDPAQEAVPYLLLIDGKGNILWKGHGVASDDLQKQLEAELGKPG